MQETVHLTQGSPHSHIKQATMSRAIACFAMCLPVWLGCQRKLNMADATTSINVHVRVTAIACYLSSLECQLRYIRINCYDYVVSCQKSIKLHVW